MQDFVIYLMSGTSTIFGCCREHSTGEDEERLKVDILLFAPDVLPQHCCVRRQDSSGPEAEEERGEGEGRSRRRTATLLKPLHGAPVTRNGLLLKEEEVELSPGDLVGLGKHYLFMFKDPTGAPGTPQAPSWMSSLDSDSRSSCASCGSAVEDGTSPRRRSGSGGRRSSGSRRSSRRPPPPPPRWRDPEGTEALLSYQPEQEDQVLQEILDRADAAAAASGGGEVPKLTAAFLLSLCIQHSAATFQPAQFRQLLLRVASGIQQVTWVSVGGREGGQVFRHAGRASSVSPSLVCCRRRRRSSQPSRPKRE